MKLQFLSDLTSTGAIFGRVCVCVCVCVCGGGGGAGLLTLKLGMGRGVPLEIFK